MGKLCFVFVAVVLSLVLSACSGMIATTTIAGNSTTESTTFKVLIDGNLLKQAKEFNLESKFIAMKIFSIILIVLAILLIAYSFVMILKNVNIIKCNSKIFSIVGLVLIVLFLIATIGVFVSSITYSNAMAEK